MKFDLSDFLELDTKALLAVNGGASCSGGSCSSSVSKNTGSCGTSGGNCSSFGGSCGSFGGSCGGTCGGVGTGDTGDMGNNGEVEGANGGDGGIDGNEGVSGWGKLTNETAKNSTMQDHAANKEIDSSMNGNNDFSKVGCKMEGASKLLTEIKGKDIDITEVNGDYDTNKDGLMTQAEITAAIEKNLSENQTVSSDYWEKQLTKEKLDEIANSQEGITYVLGRAEDVCGGQHWIVLEGYSVNENGQVVFDYNGTSKNDALNNRTYILGELTAEQKANNYYQISKIETYTII